MPVILQMLLFFNYPGLPDNWVGIDENPPKKTIFKNIFVAWGVATVYLLLKKVPSLFKGLYTFF